MIENIIVTFIFLLSSFITIFFVLKKPSFEIKFKEKTIRFETFYLGVLAGALVIIFLKILTLEQIVSSIKGDERLSPIGILILFFSMVFISIFLDICGFFEYCAKQAIKFSGNSGKKLFFALYATVSVLTIFTSNDIIILTFTPFIYYFAKDAKIDPLPYLIAEFFAANTWSMMLYVGNPTNILIASAFNIGFFEYMKYMFLPTLAAGIANMFAIYLLFKKKIDVKIKVSKINPDSAIKDRFGAFFGLFTLILCIITLSLAPYLNFKMWIVSLFFALILILFIVVRIIYNVIVFVKHKETFENKILRETTKKLPWSIIPFVLSLFILVESLEQYGIFEIVGNLFYNIYSGHTHLYIWVFGISSTLFANILNNIPMTVAYISLLSTLTGKVLLGASFATTIGSNLGANLTPIGALAGIMWMSILKNHGFKLSFAEFSKYGIIVTSITLAVALTVLTIEFMI